VDFDAEGLQKIPTVIEYFKPMEKAREADHLITAYAGDGVLDDLFDAGVIDIGYQSAGWNYHGGCARASLLQKFPPVMINGFQMDRDVAIVGDGKPIGWTFDGPWPAITIPKPVIPEEEPMLLVKSQENAPNQSGPSVYLVSGTKAIICNLADAAAWEANGVKWAEKPVSLPMLQAMSG
jgi:hypothetical protein